MDESKFYDKLDDLRDKQDELRKDLASHEKGDRDSHDAMSKDIVTMQGDVKGCNARLDAHSKTLEAIQSDLKDIGQNVATLVRDDDPSALRELREKVDSLSGKVDTLDRDVARNVEERQARKELRTVIRDRIIWWLVPILLGGFVVMAAESMGLIDMIDHKGESDHSETAK